MRVFQGQVLVLQLKIRVFDAMARSTLSEMGAVLKIRSMASDDLGNEGACLSIAHIGFGKSRRHSSS